MTRRYVKERRLSTIQKRHREKRTRGKQQEPISGPSVVIEAGVLLDIESAWRDCAEVHLHRTLTAVSNAWSLPDRYGLSEAEAITSMNRFEAKGFWARIEPYPEARNMLYALDRMGAAVSVMANVAEAYGPELNLSLGGMVDPQRILTMGLRATALERATKLKRLAARAYLDIDTRTLNAVVSVVPALACLHRGYSGMELPDATVAVIDDMMDFPEMLSHWFKRPGSRVA